MMMSPATMALAAITVMLWLLWSDSIRGRKPTPLLYAIRIALFIIMAGVLLVNLIRHPDVFAGTARALAIAAVVVGIIGAGYFAKRLTTR